MFRTTHVSESPSPRIPPNVSHPRLTGVLQPSAPRVLLVIHLGSLFGPLHRHRFPVPTPLLGHWIVSVFTPTQHLVQVFNTIVSNSVRRQYLPTYQLKRSCHVRHESLP